MRCTIVCSAAVMALAASLCSPPSTTTDGKIDICVSIIPQQFFVERIGAQRVSVQTLVGPGQDPHTFSPTPAQMSRLSRTVLFVRTGIEFEANVVPRILALNPRMKVLDLRQGLTLRTMEPCDHADQEEHDDHDRHDGHGPQCDHAHHPVTPNAGIPDPHIWLDPVLLKTQTALICTALCSLDPQGADQFRSNCTQLNEELDSLHQDLTRILSPLKGRKLLVYHPAFGYFAQRYGMEQIAVEMEGKEPTARQLTALIDTARAHAVPVLFIQPGTTPQTAQAISRALRTTTVMINQLPVDYLSEMRAMASAIEKGLQTDQ